MTEDREPFKVELRPGCKKTHLARFHLDLFKGENWIIDEDIVVAILTAPGSIEINNDKAVEAVELGYISGQAAADLGYQIQDGVDGNRQPIYIQPSKKDPIRIAIRVPDFGKYADIELHGYAERENLVLKGEWGFDQKVNACHGHAMKKAKRLEAKARAADKSASKSEGEKPKAEPKDEPRPRATPPKTPSTNPPKR